MLSALTRRSLVVAAPVAIAAATHSVHAGCNPDAALLALRGPFERTWKSYSEALDAYSLVEAELGVPAKGPGIAKADALVRKASAANRKIVEKMCDIPARTVEGLAFKAKVSRDHETTCSKSWSTP